MPKFRQLFPYKTSLTVVALLAVIAALLSLAPAARGQTVSGDATPTTSPTATDTALATGAVTRFEYASDLGDYIGLGKSGVVDPSMASFAPSSQYAGSATIRIWNASGTESWHFQFAPAPGEQLHPGTYPLATRSTGPNRQGPGIEVEGNGGGCNVDYGSFTIQRIEFDPTGAVSVLEASFVQHCETSTGPELRGVIVYNAPPSDPIPALPPAQAIPGPDGTSFSWIAQSNDPSYSTENRSATYDAQHYGIALSGDLRALTFTVDTPTPQDPSSRVTVYLGVPNNQQLAVGTYTRTTDYVYSDTQPHLNVLAITGCLPQLGRFTIDQIGTDAYGQVDHLLAHFVIHCETSTGPATYGTIRYRIDPSTAPPFAEQTLPPAPDPSSSSFRFVSAPGEPSADGASGFYDLSTSELWMRYSGQTGFDVYVYRGAETWVLGFGLPTGHPLTPGTYTVNNPPAADGSVINVQGQLNNKSVKCNLERGSFTIYQIHTDEWDQVDSVEVGFQAQCKDRTTGGYDPPVAGLLRYNVAHPLAPNAVTLPSGPWSHPGPTPAAADLLIPSSDLAPYAFARSGLADNRAANASPLQSWHSAPYDQLGRIGGTLQQADHGDESLFALGSVFKDPASATSAWSDIVDGGAWQHNQDCQRRAGTRCSLSPFLIRQGVFSQSAILQLNRCSMEVLYRTPMSHFGGQGPVESPAFDHLIRVAGERLQTACGIYDFGVAAPKILRCSGSGKSLHCGTSGARAPRRGATVQFAYTLSVKSQPNYAAYTVRETVQDPHGRGVQRLTRTLKTSKTAALSMPPVRLAASGRWTFSTAVSAGGQTKKTSASIRVY